MKEPKPILPLYGLGFRLGFDWEFQLDDVWTHVETETDYRFLDFANNAESGSAFKGTPSIIYRRLDGQGPKHCRPAKQFTDNSKWQFQENLRVERHALQVKSVETHNARVAARLAYESYTGTDVNEKCSLWNDWALAQRQHEQLQAQTLRYVELINREAVR